MKKRFDQFLCKIGFHDWKSKTVHQINPNLVVVKMTCRNCPFETYFSF